MLLEQQYATYIPGFAKLSVHWCKDQDARGFHHSSFCSRTYWHHRALQAAWSWVLLTMSLLQGAHAKSRLKESAQETAERMEEATEATRERVKQAAEQWKGKIRSVVRPWMRCDVCLQPRVQHLFMLLQRTRIHIRTQAWHAA